MGYFKFMLSSVSRKILNKIVVTEMSRFIILKLKIVRYNLLSGFSTILYRFRRIYLVQNSLRENHATNIIPSHRFYLFSN